MAKRHQVIVVGGGPVGIALAVQLGLRGVSCALLETRTGMHNIPKGQNLTHRTLEHFHFMGIADELRAARVMAPNAAIGEITAYRDFTNPYWHAPAGRELVHDYYFQRNDRLPQYRMEMVLRDKMAKLPNVEARFGWTATRVEQDANGVRVTASLNGETEMFEADYVVGCDGGHSIVRQQIGIPRSGTDFDQLMVLVVFRSSELNEELGKRFPVKSIYRVMHPDLRGYWKFFGRVVGSDGFFFHAPVPADTTRDNFDFLALMQKATGFKFSCEFEHVGFWDLRVAVAERYRVGRALIAGDAAHSHPPYGGFGLNNGLEDATNLSWKLAARLEGWGGDKLLASYDAERRPIFEEVGEHFIARRIENDGKFYDRYSPERDRAEWERAWKTKETDVGDRALDYDPCYEASPVIAGPPGGVTRARGEHVFHARIGHHLVPQMLSSGRNVFEELGRGFTLFAFGVDDAAVAAFERAAKALGVPFKSVRDTYADGRMKYETRMILVRPDQFIAWAGDTAPADADALMRKVAGRD
ncbi:MAG: monooxygenase [Alphaproteobacteria bacterium]|nr:monooxygenase [Alphaproteobacteria bacterium]